MIPSSASNIRGGPILRRWSWAIRLRRKRKTRRLAIVQEKQRAIQIRQNAAYVGRVEECLVEGFNKATGQWIGRTSQNKPLNFLRPGADEDLQRPLRGSAGDARGSQFAGRRVCKLKSAGRRKMEVEMKIRGLMMDPRPIIRSWC